MSEQTLALLLAGLTGLVVGVLLGRWSKSRDWKERERLLLAAYRSHGCFVRDQVLVNDERSSHET